MPFIGPVMRDDARWWRQVWTVDLRQRPESEPGRIEFDVLAEFGYSAEPPRAWHDGTPSWPGEAVQHVVPEGMKTDLATVPPFLWGVVASYGRQTLPAILHDMLCYAAQLPGLPAPYRRGQRRAADALFRRTLADGGAGLVRRWLMWSGVRVGSSRALAVAFAVVLAVLVAVLLAPWDAAPATAAALVLLILVMLALSLESERRPQPLERPRRYADGTGTPSSHRDEYEPARFRGEAFVSLAGAVAIGAVAAPLLLPVALVTLVTARILRIGEAPLPPGFTPVPDPTGIIPEGVIARIEWRPLLPARAHGRG